MSDSEIDLFGPLADLARLIETRAVSPVDVASAQLARIRTNDPYYGAYVVVDEAGAMTAAQDAEAAIANGGYKGPLHGVPVAVKDIFAVDGLPTRCGSVIPEQLVQTEDAAVVSQLRAAGAVILGKVATTEFALSGYHPTLAPPQNPWGRDRWPGVSSSGSGVAVASGMAFGALGTDTGGSVRFPAAANGIVGLKPTYERLSRSGVFPLAPSLDHVGVFARRVEDAALLYRAAGGGAALPAEAGRRRIGVDPRFVEANADPEVSLAVAQAIAVLQGLGHEIVTVDFSVFAEAAAFWGPITALDAWEVHRELYARHADKYGPVFRDLLEQGKAVSVEEKAAVESARGPLAERFLALFRDADVLACPSAPLPAMKNADFPPDLILPPEMVAQFVTFTAPANISGAPTISAPCGRSSDGMPLSLQLIGPKGGEQRLINLMRGFEEATDWKAARPADPSA